LHQTFDLETAAAIFKRVGLQEQVAESKLNIDLLIYVFKGTLLVIDKDLGQNVSYSSTRVHNYNTVFTRV